MKPLPWDMVGAIFGGLSFLLTLLLVEWHTLGIWRRIVIALIIGIIVFLVIYLIAPQLFPIPGSNPTATSPAGISSSPPTTPTPSIYLDYPINSHLSNITVTFADWFDNSPDNNWDGDKNSINAANGILLVHGHTNSAYWRRLKTFQEGEGALISFKLDENSNFEFYFDDPQEQFNTNSYKRFGFATGPRNGTEASVWDGTNWVGTELQTPKTGVWYNMLLAIGRGPYFLLLIWERDNPANQIIYSRQDFTQWHDIGWGLIVNSFYGTVQFDNYAEISFSGLK
jgi:hypothetical protein